MYHYLKATPQEMPLIAEELTSSFSVIMLGVKKVLRKIVVCVKQKRSRIFLSSTILKLLCPRLLFLYYV